MNSVTSSLPIVLSSLVWVKVPPLQTGARIGSNRSEPDAVVRGDRPVRVVGDFPRVAVGVDEDAAVAAPEGLGGLAADGRTGLPGLFDHGIDLRRRAQVERQGHPSPATVVV